LSGGWFVSERLWFRRAPAGALPAPLSAAGCTSGSFAGCGASSPDGWISVGVVLVAVSALASVGVDEPLGASCPTEEAPAAVSFSDDVVVVAVSVSLVAADEPLGASVPSTPEAPAAAALCEPSNYFSVSCEEAGARKRPASGVQQNCRRPPASSGGTSDGSATSSGSASSADGNGSSACNVLASRPK
jgi:hypothetical protein